ncbi:response regulator [Chitinophaga vietnamensis]|uniref:response regulator n=1 Tax=Chitinophaga vietnamensis TaxID=2593957 RepID=UPI001178809A|nr:response regulator [Chitinophaga vietnamensis]
MNNSIAQILVADDDPEDLFLMRMMCSELAFADIIHFVEDGKNVLDYLEGIYEITLPELIVLDLNMPRMSGTQTLEALHHDPRFQRIPVIIYSTSLNEYQRKRCMELGAKAYVIKPSTYAEGLLVMQHFHEYSKGHYSFPALSA